MFRMFIAPAVFVAVFTLMGGQAQAAEDGHATHHPSEGAQHVGDTYPLKVDPLGDSLIEVDKPIVIVHDGRELRFASEDNLKKFKADPAKYLAEVDQKIIAQQKPLYPLQTCVVSGEKLGEMGEPIDMVYGNRLVRFCCKGCVGKFKEDPAKHLAKIDAAVIEAQKADYPMDTCVVSGEKLGGEMGDPIDYVIGNRLIRFCCKGCVKMFEKNPAKYLAKLDTAVIEAQKADYPLDTCVVSGEKLGEMGEPIDMVYGNRLVRFCCKGCVKMFEKDPAKYLAKLDAHGDHGDHDE